MKRILMTVVLLGVAWPVLAQEAVQTPSMLLQKAIYAEKTEADLDKAIGLYEQVVKVSVESRRILALAVFRLGSCYAQKGLPEMAEIHFERLVEEFSEYTSLVKRAKKELAKLDPVVSEPEVKKTELFFDGLEDGADVPDGWQKQGKVPGVDYVWDKQVASEGHASLCFNKTADKYFPIAQWVRKVEHSGEGTQLMVSAKVKAVKVTKAIIDVLFLDKDGEWIKHEWVAYIGPKKSGSRPFTHEWKLYSGQVKIPENTATMVVGLQMYGPGKVWFDEIGAAYVPEVIEPVKPMTDMEAEHAVAEAWQLWQTGKYTEAEKQFKRVIQSRPKLDVAYQGLGWAQLNSGQKLAAFETFEACLKINPNNAAALNGLGWIAYRDKDMDKAIVWWEKGVTVTDGGATACLAGLTRVYMEQENYDLAIKYYTLWLKVDPKSNQAQEGLDKAKLAKEAM
jgi:tetratricopeptide (TPR) repeat protein